MKAASRPRSMLKDLRLAMEAAQSVDAYTPMGAEAETLYARFADLGGGGKDFSAIIKMIDDSWPKPERPDRDARYVILTKVRTHEHGIARLAQSVFMGPNQFRMTQRPPDAAPCRAAGGAAGAGPDGADLAGDPEHARRR